MFGTWTVYFISCQKFMSRRDNVAIEKPSVNIEHRLSNSFFVKNPPMTRQMYRSRFASDSRSLVEMVLLSIGNSYLARVLYWRCKVMVAGTEGNRTTVARVMYWLHFPPIFYQIGTKFVPSLVRLARGTYPLNSVSLPTFLNTSPGTDSVRN